MSDNLDYEIGYKRPPKSGQFKKGQSGNPKGRVKSVQNTMAYLEKAMNSLVTINQNGRRQNVTKHEAIIMQLVNKAASGDRKATQDFMKLATLYEGRQESKESPGFKMTEEDYEIIQEIARRNNKKGENQ